MKDKSILRFIILLCLCVHAFTTYSINIPFVSPVYNYNTNTSDMGSQNWAIAQDSRGIIYIGNNSGLVSFDGTNWILNKLPNERGVKSIYVETVNDANDKIQERIYVGSFEEFGYFERDINNTLIYYSLKEQISDYKFMNDEIWTIVKHRDIIYFQSFSSYFSYDRRSVEANSSFSPLFFFSVEDRLFAQGIDEGVFELGDNSTRKSIVNRDQLAGDNVVAIINKEDNLLLFTSRNGIYIYNIESQKVTRWKTLFDEELKEGVINRAISLSESVFVVGTINKGLYAINDNGELLWHLDIRNGLNNNTVLGLLKDRSGNLWAALDNGISNIRINSFISLFEPTDIQIGMVEDIVFSDDEVYVASNQGVYHFNKQVKSFRQLPGFDIQTWYMKKIDNQIFAGHNKGTSFIDKEGFRAVEGSSIGATGIARLSNEQQDVLIESTYSYLSVFTKDKNGLWIFSHNIRDGFVDLISHIEIDHTGNIWLNHMYKGVYRLRLDNDFQNVIEKEYFEQLDSLGSTSRLKLMKLRGRIILTDGASFYTYDDLLQKIVPFEQLNSQLPELNNTYKVVSINDNLHWFIRDNEYTLIEYTNGKYKVIDTVPYSILNNPPNKDRANIYVDYNGISYFCLNGGIGRYNNVEDEIEISKQLFISSAWSYNRKDNTQRFLALNENNIMEFNENSINVIFSYPDFSKKVFHVECYLENYDNRWVSTNSDLSISYPNLKPNDYILKARVLNDLGEELSLISFSFQIKHPWYQSTWAYLLYFFITIILLSALITGYVRYAIKKSKRKFEEQEQKRIAQLNERDKMIATLKSERLQSDLSHKSKELANATMLIINHEDFLKELINDIQQNYLSGKIQKKQSQQLIEKINRNISEDDEWAVFQENFDLIHKNFFRNLKTTYPSLTPADLRLCALLRLNYTSKEIAKMQNLSLRGVEAARYRLRKKIDIQENEDLVSFMINFS